MDIEVVCAFVICDMWLRASLGRWLLDVRTELKVAVSILKHSHTKIKSSYAKRPSLGRIMTSTVATLAKDLGILHNDGLLS